MTKVTGRTRWASREPLDRGLRNLHRPARQHPLRGRTSPLHPPPPAVPGRESTTEVLDTTTAGRHRLVVVTEAADGRDYIITARDMTTTDKRTFRAKGH